MMTAIYNSKTVYLSYISIDQSYVLASHYEDSNKTFKINVSELTEINGKIENLPNFNKE